MSLGKRLITTGEAGGIDGTANFSPFLYTGAGGTSHTGVGFAPDLVWIKRRDNSGSHYLFDKNRGVHNALTMESIYSEISNTQYLTAFGSDGFTLGTNSALSGSGNTYVAWCWKAGGSSVSNTDGNIASNVSVNTDAGFSIVNWQGAGTGGNDIGHGLGVKPDLIFIRNRSNARNWRTYVNATGFGATKFMNLDTTEVVATYGSFGDTEPDTSVFYTSTVSAADRATNYAGDNYVAYCFANIAGYQKIGTYEGNNDSGDQSITGVGFQPRFLLLKDADDTGNWVIIDSTRGNDEELYPNLNNAEANEPNRTTLDSDGFTVRNGRYNNNGDTFIYLAIA